VKEEHDEDVSACASVATQKAKSTVTPAGPTVSRFRSVLGSFLSYLASVGRADAEIDGVSAELRPATGTHLSRVVRIKGGGRPERRGQSVGC